MPKNKNRQTAFGAATARLIEQYQPENLRLFTDDLLQHLLSYFAVIFLKFKRMRVWTINDCDANRAGGAGNSD